VILVKSVYVRQGCVVWAIRRHFVKFAACKASCARENEDGLIAASETIRLERDKKPEDWYMSRRHYRYIYKALAHAKTVHIYKPDNTEHVQVVSDELSKGTKRKLERIMGTTYNEYGSSMKHGLGDMAGAGDILTSFDNLLWQAPTCASSDSSERGPTLVLYY